MIMQEQGTFRRTISLARRFTDSANGNVTMILALAAVPAVLAAGAAIDYARITRESAAFHSAVDSAAMAIVASDRASVSGLSETALNARMSELEALALDFITKNYVPQFGGDDHINVDLEIDGTKVRLSASHDYPTTFMRLAGIDYTSLSVTSEVKKAARPVEIAMVMDTTGSMGTTYMNDAKVAARSLLQTLYGGSLAAKPDSENIRVALVPFSGAVRLNTSAYDFDMNWIDTDGDAAVSRLNFSNSGWHNYFAWQRIRSQPWNGCVEARSRGTSDSTDYATLDTPPASGDTLFTPYFAPDEPTFTNSTSQGFYNSFISNSGTPNEQTGLASTSTSSSNWLNRQNNVSKYVNKTITNESSSSYGPWFNCAKSSVVPMTYDRASVEAGITAMTSSGSTVIPEGLAWGWRVLSPTEPFTLVEGSANQSASTISAYGSARWQKILVLMTDGENDVLSGGNQVNTLNGTWYSAFGRGKASAHNRFKTTTTSATSGALDTAMLKLCANIKASGITVYTVAFRVNSSTILGNLQQCATSPSHFSYAANGVALAAIFNHIGENVANTSIYLSE
jgi:Flp pilus assembly protein TadG